MPRNERTREEKVSLPALEAAAEPLGVRGFRKQLSRPWERDAQVARLVHTLLKEKTNVLNLTTFRSTIIIMTSNLGADRAEPIGLGKSPPPRL